MYLVLVVFFFFFFFFVKRTNNNFLLVLNSTKKTINKDEIFLAIDSRMRTIYPYRLDEGFSSKFSEGHLKVAGRHISQNKDEDINLTVNK